MIVKGNGVKMNKIEKLAIILSGVVLILMIIVKIIVGYNDMGILVTLSLLGIMMWIIFWVCAFFPADWRMTQNQRKKIDDKYKYQRNYRKIMISVDVVVVLVFSALIMMVC